MKTPALLIPLIFALTLQQTTAQQPRQPNKTALVIGNSGYRYSPQLPEPAGEARAMKAALERIGFQVELLIDGGQEQMLDAVERFEELLKRRGGTALFHYGGHGVQVDGENYLLAVDREIPHEGRVRTRAVPVSEIIASMQASPSDTNIVILDACRDNPLPPDTRSTNVRGLAPIAKTPPNTLIAFSADSGQLAKDGLFTPTLLKYIEEPGIDILEVLSRVRGDVYAASNRTQLPTDFNQLFGSVYLAGPPEDVAPASSSERYGNPENNLDSNVELSAAPAESPITATITGGSSVVASLDYSGQIDRYAVSMRAGQTLIAYTTGLTDTLGRLTDSEGIGIIADNNAGEGNNFRIAHTVEEAGTYYITVSGSSDASGSYRLSVEVTDHPPGSLEIYQHITMGFDWGDISSGYGSLSLREQFSVLRIGYSSHRGKGIVGFGYKGNLGVSLQKEVSYSDYVRKTTRNRYNGNSTYEYEKVSGTRSFGLGNQIHVGQFFGASFKIIDKGAIRWFAAVGLSMDSIFNLTTSISLDFNNYDFYSSYDSYYIYTSGFSLLIGPELNSYLTYMFNPSFGLSLGVNFAYYFFHSDFSEHVQIISSPSGGFGIFATFAPQGVKPRDRRLLHGDWF